jgi:hypothetical protein
MKINTDISYIFDKTYDDIRYIITLQYINDDVVISLIINEEVIDEDIDISEIVEYPGYFKSLIPDYITELFDVSEVVNDVDVSIKEMWETWQW